MTITTPAQSSPLLPKTLPVHYYQHPTFSLPIPKYTPNIFLSFFQIPLRFLSSFFPLLVTSSSPLLSTKFYHFPILARDLTLSLLSTFILKLKLNDFSSHLFKIEWFMMSLSYSTKKWASLIFYVQIRPCRWSKPIKLVGDEYFTWLSWGIKQVKEKRSNIHMPLREKNTNITIKILTFCSFKKKHTNILLF